MPSFPFFHFVIDILCYSLVSLSLPLLFCSFNYILCLRSVYIPVPKYYCYCLFNSNMGKCNLTESLLRFDIFSHLLCITEGILSLNYVLLCFNMKQIHTSCSFLRCMQSYVGQASGIAELCGPVYKIPLLRVSNRLMQWWSKTCLGITNSLLNAYKL